MSEASTPKTWWEATSAHIVWGALVFTCFLVFVEKLLERDFGTALAALLLGLGIAAVALHSKTWLERTNPNWAYSAAVVVVSALILSPFVEEKRWPLSVWFQSSAPATVIHDPPSNEDIAAATKPFREQNTAIAKQLGDALAERDMARSEAANSKSQLEEKRRELEVAQAALETERRSKALPSPQTAQPATSPPMSAEEKAIKIEIWRGIDDQMTILAKALDQGFTLLDSWPTEIKSDRSKALKAATDFNTSLNEVKNTLQNIYTSYLNYGDVSDALNEVRYVRAPYPMTVFDKISYSLGAFMHQLQILPEPLPQGFEGSVRLSSTALRRDINLALEWQSKTRKVAADKINKLSSAGSK